MIANFKIKSMRYLMALAMVLISLSPISCKKEKGGSSELREIVITHPENGTMTIIQGESELIKYSTVPAEAEYEVALEWTSDDENVATVKNGRVKAHAPGTTTVHAKYESVSASVKVTVTAVPVTSFTVPAAMNAYLDMPTPVRLTVQPENANAASLQWDTDNPDIAYVEVNQGVAYIKAAKEGACTISAYAENISTTKKIKVAVYPTIFKLMRKSISDESGYVEVKNEDSFDIADIGVPDYEGKRAIEMIRADGEKLKETSVQISSDNPNVISVTKRPRSETKVLIFAVEGKEFGAAKITASLNEEGSTFTKTFTVRVSKASFPAGTKICIRVDGHIEPVGESTTIRASYDGRNDAGFGLMDASGNYVTTFTNFKWTIESPSCECNLSTVGASGVVVAPISTTTFSGSKTATLVCTDDAGNRLTHKIIIASPNAFSGVQNLRVTVDGKSYTSNAKVDIGKTATIDISKSTFDSSYDGLKWENVGALGSVYGTTKLNNNGSGSLMSIEFTPNRKMEAMPISVEDEIGQVRKIYISSAKFHFPDGAKLYYSYTELNPTNSGWKEAISGVPLRPNISTKIKIATSETGAPVVDKTYYYQVWASAIEQSKNNKYVNEFSPSYLEYNVFSVFANGCPPRDQAPQYYSIVAEDDYGTSLRNAFCIRELLKFDSSTKFEICMKGLTSYVDYAGGNTQLITVPKSKFFSDGSIGVQLSLGYTIRYPFPEARITNSVGKESEYTEYHREFLRIYPAEHGATTSVVLYDDSGNSKTIQFKVQ